MLLPGRLLVRRLPALRRDGALLAGDGRGEAASPRPAARCSASATASRCCARPGSCPGVLVRNHDLHFVCDFVHVRVERARRAVHLARARRARCCACRSSTARAPTPRRRRLLDRARARTARSCSATATPRARRAPPRIRTARCANIAGIAQRGGQRDRPDAAPRARRRGAASAARDGAVLLGSLVDFVRAAGAA